MGCRRQRSGGRYELRGVLGRGGMAEVRDGWDTRLDRPVAIKLLYPVFSMQPDNRRRFEIEQARAAAGLNHPHIVAVHDSGDHDGTSLHRHGAVVGAHAVRPHRRRAAAAVAGAASSAGTCAGRTSTSTSVPVASLGLSDGSAAFPLIPPGHQRPSASATTWSAALPKCNTYRKRTRTSARLSLDVGPGITPRA